MALGDHQFDVQLPTDVGEAWWYQVQGASCWRYGPFPSRAEALGDLEARFQAWRRRARCLGGWAWRRTQREWVVTVPDGVAVPGRPLRRAPCTRHGGALPALPTAR